MPEVLDPAVVDASLADGMAWTRQDDELVKTRRGKDFADSLAFVNAVGALADAMGHHPDIDIRWNTVRLALTTHDSGGITLLDLALAGVVDRLRPDSRDSGDGAAG
jgi:4a-hydroxytetrahydrobiopterin dehydratase